MTENTHTTAAEIERARLFLDRIRSLTGEYLAADAPEVRAAVRAAIDEEHAAMAVSDDPDDWEPSDEFAACWDDPA